MSTVSYVDNLSITDGSQYVSSGAIHWEDDFNSNLSRWAIGVDASSHPLAVYDGGNGEMDISTKDNFPSIYSQDISATVGETYGVSLEVMASTGTANPSCAGQGSGSLYAELEFYVNSQWVSYSANVFSPITTAPAVVYLAGVKAPSDKMRIKIRYLAPPCASQYWNTVTADLTSIKVTKKIWQSDRYNNYDFGARIYDPRIARWLSLDPLAKKFTSLSPYNFVGNTPLRAVDPDGKDIYILFSTKGNRKGGEDEMFGAAARTRAEYIRNSAFFDGAKDIVVVLQVSDISMVKYEVRKTIAQHSGKYGETREVGIWSHGGWDGPISPNNASE